MKSKGLLGEILKSDWRFCLPLIPVLTAWICDRCAPADMRGLIGATISLLLTLALVVVLRNQRQEMAQIAIMDAPTGVFNSSYLRIELEREVFLSHRTNVPFSMIFLNVDGLKSVNDRRGHSAGNAILRRIGLGLCAHVRRHMDLCFRFGGDEFIVLCPHADLAVAREVACRVHGIPGGDALLHDNKITLSVGVIQLRWSESPDDFMMRADRAMSSVKRNGKNGVGFDAEGGLVPTVAEIAHEA